jgi:ATP-dependent DNA helicase RecQ
VSVCLLYYFFSKAPGSIFAYYQMVGRAGRSELPAYGILMTGAEDSDVQEHFWKTAFPERGEIDDILQTLSEHRDTGLTEMDLEEFVNIRPREIVKVRNEWIQLSWRASQVPRIDAMMCEYQLEARAI